MKMHFYIDRTWSSCSFFINLIILMTKESTYYCSEVRLTYLRDEKDTMYLTFIQILADPKPLHLQ